ncbi:D-ribose pyranase, partial [Oceanobacillus caeni]
MKKNGILNSNIAKVLVDLGHTDTIVIGDAGLPVPDGVLKIDLALTPGTPSFQEVVKAVVDDMVIEKVTIAEEMKDTNPNQHEFM